MNILHIAPHLGGGVGKAHAAIRSVLPGDVIQTFVLLEAPRDRRHADMIEAAGARVLVAGGLGEVAALAGKADIVQFEFWNHPRLFECLARCAFPAMRSVFWSHISGLGRPVVPPGLVEAAGRFVLTTEASRTAPFMAIVSDKARAKVSAINSGFGFVDAPRRISRAADTPRIAYLGTVDFVKLHPGFFDAIDALEGNEVRVSVWGEASADVVKRARAMRHPDRIVFRGQTADPMAALAEADIFFYPLQREHYGTAENALVEAMSLGLVPLVLNNPAEAAIVQDGETGLVATSIESCVAALQKLLASPDTVARMSGNAIRHISATRTPERSAADFIALWSSLSSEPKRACDFRSIVGDTPADWFLATQCLPGGAWSVDARRTGDAPSKGALAHFEAAFPGDGSLLRLACSRQHSAA